VLEIGTGSITFTNMGKKAKINLIELRNVLYVPEIYTNLFLLLTIIDKGYDFIMSRSKGTKIL
jgi:Pol polyprotein, beta-barrel domain